MQGYGWGRGVAVTLGGSIGVINVASNSAIAFFHVRECQRLRPAGKRGLERAREDLVFHFSQEEELYSMLHARA